MSFEEARNSLVISFAEDSISEEEFLTLYHEYESVNPLCPYWEFEPFCLDSLDSSECKSEYRQKQRSKLMSTGPFIRLTGLIRCSTTNTTSSVQNCLAMVTEIGNQKNNKAS